MRKFCCRLCHSGIQEHYRYSCGHNLIAIGGIAGTFRLTSRCSQSHSGCSRAWLCRGVEEGNLLADLQYSHYQKAH